ncbi:ABC transporter permease [Microbacterium halophytorum]|uniref:ABC transporter permease n=1 Tax=Microbacterium halophytorum TaxID=2067568 RepID=UPI000CFD7076|nr:ABC transporter permease subunit [Microbacterium halophytorum]
MKPRTRRFVLASAVFVVLLAVWWMVTALRLVPETYLPTPGAVVAAFVESNTCRPISEGSSRMVCGEFDYFMWQHLIASLGRIAVGVGAAIVLGPIIGFMMGTIGWMRDAFDPYINFLRALPPLGYVGLLIVWFGIGDVSKYWLLFLAAFPPLVIATMNGVRGVKQDHIRAAQSMGASRLQVATKVLLPSVLPELLSGIRIATGFAWTTVVAAELNNGIPGIGGLAYQSGTQLQTALTIACIIVIGIVAVALDSLIKIISRLLTPWHGRV